MNVIHDRPYNGSAGLYLDSTDRGPMGGRGEKGDDGDKGDTGDTGTSVVGVYIDDNDHLITKMSDSTEVDAGEMPKVISRRAFACEIDGTTNVIPIAVPINKERVTHILINGVTYTNGYFAFNDAGLVLDFPNDKIPAGKLEVFANTHSRAGEVEIPLDLVPITADELNVICDGEEV